MIGRLSILFIIVLLSGCAGSKNDAGTYRSLDGETMGTTYRITYLPVDKGVRGEAIDSILILINQAASTYIPESLISRFNRSESGITIEDAGTPNSVGNFFEEIFFISRDVTDRSHGYYDPTVMPLVNFWGFGYEEKKPVEAVDSSKVLEIVSYVGFDKVSWSTSDGAFVLTKDHPGVELDFSSVAKGYAIDILGAYLVHRKVEHFFIDIGGEIGCRGMNPRGSKWATGINRPDPKAAATDIYQVIHLTDMAIATSGNYRNFYRMGEVSYGHTINPLTGYPESSDLLSASVIARDCAVADAYATACMAMGRIRARDLIETTGGVEAMFIYHKEGEYASMYTSGFDRFITNENSQ